MEINLQFEMDLIWSIGRDKLRILIFKKYLSQLEKIYKDLYNLYVEQRIQMANLRRDGRIIPPGERRYFPTCSKFLLLCRFANFNGHIIVSINGKEEKEYIDNLERFLLIQPILNKIIFETHSNKLEMFNRRKNIKVEIKLEGVKRTAINRRLSI